MKVYLKQNDSFYSLSYREWIELCQECAKAGVLDLDGYKELKRKPPSIVHDKEHNSYYAVKNDVIFLEPIDWCPDNFAQWLEENEIIEKYWDEEEEIE